MKALLKLIPNYKGFSTLTLMSCFLFAAVICNPVVAQESNAEITVKGKVIDDDGPLADVNILLKDTYAGTKTKRDGTFVFPIELKPGSVLVFSYLGYRTEEIEITENTSYIELTMALEDIDILEAVEVDTPYQSKRTNKKH